MKSLLRNSFPTFNESIVPAQPAPLVDKVSDDEIYYGYADLNTAETAKEWLIVKVWVDGTVTRTEYPNAEMVPNQAWSERASLSYAR
jgi:hypothetical protein